MSSRDVVVFFRVAESNSIRSKEEALIVLLQPF